MKTAKQLALMPVLLLGASCAQMTDWSPTVDTANDHRGAQLDTDMGQCRQLANQAANSGMGVSFLGEKIGIGAGTGTLTGAASGALIGAIVGGPATGAAIGAVTGLGLGLGLFSGEFDSEKTYREAYSNCLKERGHAVVD